MKTIKFDEGKSFQYLKVGDILQTKTGNHITISTDISKMSNRCFQCSLADSIECCDIACESGTRPDKINVYFEKIKE